MKLLPHWVAACATALIAMTCEAPAVTFDERWSSMFGVTQITNETVAAKAELVRPANARSREVRSRQAKRQSMSRRGRASTGRAGRYREWYKGGKKWHYVYRRR